MAERRWDAIIVGQGLAGTVLAWHLTDAGWQVLMLDEDAAVSASKIAAGLITPITGQRLTFSSQYDEYLKTAQKFFQDVEQRTGRRFFHDRKAVRLFRSDLERDIWPKRRDNPVVQKHLLDPPPDPLLPTDIADADAGGFTMHAGQLDVPEFLAASRAVLNVEPMVVDWHSDVALSETDVQVGVHTARYLISCEGYAATRNPYFSWVPFKPAKGDVLTVRFDRPLPPNCLHHGIWVAPTAHSDVFQVGATYDWDTLDQVPSQSARDELERKLKAFVQVPYTVLDHRAAVRPIIHESNARVGLHPKHDRLGYFNGLGSKGSLHAPLIADNFADFLVHQTPLPEAYDVRKLAGS